MYGAQHRLKWDKNIVTIEQMPMQKKGLFVNYQMNKGKAGLGNRDFLDKLVYFAHEGNFYAY